MVALQKFWQSHYSKKKIFFFVKSYIFDKNTMLEITILPKPKLHRSNMVKETAHCAEYTFQVVQDVEEAEISFATARPVVVGHSYVWCLQKDTIRLWSEKWERSASINCNVSTTAWMHMHCACFFDMRYTYNIGKNRLESWWHNWSVFIAAAVNGQF